MQTTYRVRANDLSTDLIRSLKSAYRGREIEITVSEVQDETEYLLCTPANREHLLKAIADIEKESQMVELPVESIKA